MTDILDPTIDTAYSATGAVVIWLGSAFILGSRIPWGLRKHVKNSLAIVAEIVVVIGAAMVAFSLMDFLGGGFITVKIIAGTIMLMVLGSWGAHKQNQGTPEVTPVKVQNSTIVDVLLGLLAVKVLFSKR